MELRGPSRASDGADTFRLDPSPQADKLPALVATTQDGPHADIGQRISELPLPTLLLMGTATAAAAYYTLQSAPAMALVEGVAVIGAAFGELSAMKLAMGTGAVVLMAAADNCPPSSISAKERAAVADIEDALCEGQVGDFSVIQEKDFTVLGVVEQGGDGDGENDAD